MPNLPSIAMSRDVRVPGSFTLGSDSSHLRNATQLDHRIDHFQEGPREGPNALAGILGEVTQEGHGIMNKPQGPKPQPVRDSISSVEGLFPPVNRISLPPTPAPVSFFGFTAGQPAIFPNGRWPEYREDKLGSSEPEVYEPTVVDDARGVGTFQSISVMPQFIKQSHEELRLRWYQAHGRPSFALREWEQPRNRGQKGSTLEDSIEEDRTLVDGGSSDFSTLLSELMIGSTREPLPALNPAHQVNRALVSAVDLAEQEWARASRTLKAKTAALASAQAEYEEARQVEALEFAKYLRERSRVQ